MGTFYRPECLAQRRVHGSIGQQHLTSIGIDSKEVPRPRRDSTTKCGHAVIVVISCAQRTLRSLFSRRRDAFFIDFLRGYANPDRNFRVREWSDVRQSSYTALIPAIFGALLLLFGVIAQRKENLQKHLMHAAVVVALLGFIATAARLIPRLGELTFSGAEIAQISMAAVCLLFVVLAVKSFVGARRKV